MAIEGIFNLIWAELKGLWAQVVEDGEVCVCVCVCVRALWPDDRLQAFKRVKTSDIPLICFISPPPPPSNVQPTTSSSSVTEVDLCLCRQLGEFKLKITLSKESFNICAIYFINVRAAAQSVKGFFALSFNSKQLILPDTNGGEWNHAITLNNNEMKWNRFGWISGVFYALNTTKILSNLFFNGGNNLSNQDNSVSARLN